MHAQHQTTSTGSKTFPARRTASLRRSSRSRAATAAVTPDALERCTRPVLESLEDRQLMSVPDGPFAMTAIANAATQVSLNWYDSAHDAAGYRVSRENPDGTWHTVATLAGNATSYVDNSTSGGSQYVYSVCAYSAGGDSSTTTSPAVTTPGNATTPTPTPTPSPTPTGTPPIGTTVPDGPFSMTATATAPGQVNLTWYDSDKTGALYRVVRMSAGGSWQTVGFVGANATTYTDNTVTPATQYTYQVYAYNSVGDSSFTWSNVTTPAGGAGTATTPTPTPSPTPTPTPTPTVTSVPDGPFAAAAVAASSTQVNVAWYDAHSDETGYNVERSANGGSYTVVATLSATATTYVDTSATASTQYTYRIYAYNAVGVSNSTSASTTTPGTGGVSGSGGSSGGSSSSAAGYFPVGVFYQPTYSFSKWASLGVNLLYGYEKGNGDTMAQWDTAAANAGFKEIRQPSANPSTDGATSNLLAWLAPQDEPDLSGVASSALASQYAALKAANPNIPVMTNYAGGDLLGLQGGTSSTTYQQYLANTDMDAADIYPVTGWGLPNQLGLVGQVVDKLKSYAPTKQSYAFIETSNQQLPWIPNDTGVTPDQMRGEIWDAVIHGASGVVYFPQQIGNGFQFDTTPANVAAEMAVQDAKLQQYGAALLSTASTGGVSATGTGSLEVATRVYNGHKYFFVLNLSGNTVSGQAVNINGLSPNTTLSVDGENRTVSLSGTTMTDTFTPYAIHVYVA